MIEQILNNIVNEKRRNGVTNDVVRNLLKEALQYYVLDYIYNSQYGKNLIFTGGSCLRICYGLNRISEDLDLDLEWNTTINKEDFADDIMNYFKKNLQYSKIEFSIRGAEKKIYLKFPILYDLAISKKPESEKLYVKIEIAENISRYYQCEFIPLSRFNFNFLAKVYTIETLMASKIIAIIRRTFKKGKGNAITFKGRDYYDLMWFLQNSFTPDIKRLQDVLSINKMSQVYEMLWAKVKALSPVYLKEDLIPLFEDHRFIDTYCNNYQDIVRKYLLKK